MTLIYVGKLFDFGSLPYEDAAIVMRYAVHLAAGHGITWNIGEPPVDGTTDFLFLVVLAGVVKAGMGVEPAVRFVGFVAHALTILLIYFGIRDLYGKWLAGACAAYVAIGPGIDEPYWRTAKPYQPDSPDWTPHVLGCSGAVWLDFDRDGRATPARAYAERLHARARGELPELVRLLVVDVLTATTIVTVALLPLLSGPKLQTTVADPLQPVPWLTVVETKLTPGGRVSVKVTFVAVSGPLFVTSRV